MAGSQRLKRMADSVQRELSELIRQELKDPRLGGLVTISAVKVSADILNKASGFLRHELSRRIKTRITPRLRFHYDKTNAYGNYMFGLIAEAVKDLPEQGQDDKE